MTIGRTTLSQHVAQEIIGDIKLRGLRAGDEIPAEAELAERHGVNRLAVREAIRTLVARGVLISSQGKRARVAVPAPAVLEQILDFRLSQNSMDLADLLDTRRVIEAELARRAAVRRAAGEGSMTEVDRALATMGHAVGAGGVHRRGPRLPSGCRRTGRMGPVLLRSHGNERNPARLPQSELPRS